MRRRRWSVGRALDDAIAARGVATFQNGANVVGGGGGGSSARVAADGRARGGHRGRVPIARTCRSSTAVIRDFI